MDPQTPVALGMAVTPPSARRSLAGRLTRFAVVGGIGFIVDAGVLWVLTRVGVPPLAGRVGSIVVALFVTWRLNRSVTFRAEGSGSALEFGQYVLVGAASSAVNYATFAALIGSGMIASPLVALAVGSAVAMTVTFLGLDRIVYRPRNP